MKRNHLPQNLRIDSFQLHVGIPSTTCLFETEGDVVSKSDVFAVVESTEGAGGSVAEGDGGGGGLGCDSRGGREEGDGARWQCGRGGCGSEP